MHQAAQQGRAQSSGCLCRHTKCRRLPCQCLSCTRFATRGEAGIPVLTPLGPVGLGTARWLDLKASLHPRVQASPSLSQVAGDPPSVTRGKTPEIGSRGRWFDPVRLSQTCQGLSGRERAARGVWFAGLFANALSRPCWAPAEPASSARTITPCMVGRDGPRARGDARLETAEEARRGYPWPRAVGGRVSGV